MMDTLRDFSDVLFVFLGLLCEKRNVDQIAETQQVVGLRFKLVEVVTHGLERWLFASI